jgi:phasin family protein
MYPFAQSVTPAVRTHLDAQMSFINDLSKSVFRSFQQLCDLNIQLTQTMLEETAQLGQQLATADRQTELLSAAVSRAQPAAEKLRAYQQHISRVAADAQVELARVAEQHVQETTRTARALADEVQRVASEETERSMRTQQETMSKFSDPFKTGNGSAWQGQQAARGNGSGAGASMQSAGQGSQSGGQGDVQGGASMQGGAGSAGAQGAQSGGTASSATPAAKTAGGGARKET